MIERFYLKDYLSFKETELNFASGLVVFTGPSGSGKSILMNSILSSLGGTLSVPGGVVSCVNGIASITLESGSMPGTCQIQAASGSLPIGYIDVGFYSTADHILLPGKLIQFHCQVATCLKFIPDLAGGFQCSTQCLR